MGLPSEDDRDAIDRAFAELVAGYHLTADPPDPFANEPPTEPVTAPSMPDAADGTANWASDHPLFGFAETHADAQRPLGGAARGPLRARAAATAGTTRRAVAIGLDWHRLRNHHRAGSNLRPAISPPGPAGSPSEVLLVDSAS